MARFSLRNPFSRRQTRQPAESELKHPDIVVGATSDSAEDSLKAFDNSVITYSSDLASVEYDSILRDKQRNINTLYQ